MSGFLVLGPWSLVFGLWSLVLLLVLFLVLILVMVSLRRSPKGPVRGFFFLFRLKKDSIYDFVKIRLDFGLGMLEKIIK